MFGFVFGLILLTIAVVGVVIGLRLKKRASTLDQYDRRPFTVGSFIAFGVSVLLGIFGALLVFFSVFFQNSTASSTVKP